MLAATTLGHGPRIVLVHGFTQTRASWDSLAEALAGDHEVVVVDAPGHGDSAQVRASLCETADLLAEVGGRATYLGYSMGGRGCLHLALAHPTVLAGLVVVGATAGIDDAQGRAQRRAADNALARRLEAEGLEPFLATWLDQALFAGLSEEAAGLEARRQNTVEGLSAALRLSGAGTQELLWRRLASVTAPVLVVAGEADERYVALGRRLAEAFGDNATLASVPGAGHAVHLEDPDAFLGVVRPWLARHRL